MFGVLGFLGLGSGVVGCSGSGILGLWGRELWVWVWVVIGFWFSGLGIRFL